MQTSGLFAGLKPSEALAALITLKEPRLEGRLVVVYRPRATTSRGMSLLYAARRSGDEAVGLNRVHLTWGAQLGRPDFQALLKRAAQAALTVMLNDTNAAALAETEGMAN